MQHAITPGTGNFDSIYEVLDAVRSRPAIYLGGHSIELLGAFIAGVQITGVLDDGHPPFRSFVHWFIARAFDRDTTMPWAVLAEEGTPEQALDRYFGYLDEYRKTEMVPVAEALPPFVPRFRVLEGPRLVEVEPTIPYRVSIARFAPSSVFVIREHHAEGTDSHVPFFRSLEDARRGGATKWGISEEGWRLG